MTVLNSCSHLESSNAKSINVATKTSRKTKCQNINFRRSETAKSKL